MTVSGGLSLMSKHIGQQGFVVQFYLNHLWRLFKIWITKSANLVNWKLITKKL